MPTKQQAKDLTLYAAGATLAATSVSDAALVTFAPAAPDATLFGNPGTEAVDQGQIAFNPGLGTINYTRALAGGGPNKNGSYNDSTVDQLNLNPARSSGGKLANPPTADGNTTGTDAYFVGSPVAPGTTIDATNTNAPGALIGGPATPFIPVRLNNGQNFFGWVQAVTSGPDIIVQRIAFETTANTPVVTPSIAPIPESSTTMAIMGGVLAGGLVGIRSLRKKKKQSAQKTA